MSHYATIRCQALDDVKAKTLQKALKRINSKFSVKMLKDLKMNLPSLGGNAVLMKDTTPTSIRMLFTQKEDGKVGLSVCGEFYNTGFDPQSFTDELCRQYNGIKVENFAKAENLEPVKRWEDENGDVVMRFRVSA